MASTPTPDQSLRLRFFRRERPASFDEVGAQVWQLLDALAKLHPSWKQWSTRDAGFQPHRVRNVADCTKHLSGAEIEVHPGNRPSHRLLFSTAGTREQSCDLRVLFVLQGGPARWSLGLRVELRIGAAVRALGARGATLIQNVALAAIFAVRPHAGFVGTIDNPDPRWDESREPLAAWMTYLSHAANAEAFRGKIRDPKLVPIPAAPPPATVASVPDLGWLVVAFPEIMNPGESAQVAAVESLQRALGPQVRQDPLTAAPLPAAVIVPSTSAYVGIKASSRRTSPWAVRSRNLLAETSQVAVVSRSPVLPFAPAGSAAEALERAIDETDRLQGPDAGPRTDRLDETETHLDLRAIPAVLPLPKSAARGINAPTASDQHAPPPLPPPAAQRLTLEQYASLCVEIALAPAREIETLARYRITPREKVLNDEWYRERIAASPEVRAAWERSFQSYKAWLQSRQERTS